MNRVFTVTLLIGIGMSSSAFMARGDDIVSFHNNGEMKWVHFPNAKSYQIEWSSNPSGPWTNSWESLNNIVPSGNPIVAYVPMFYRVIAEVVDSPPAGMMYVPAGEFLMGDGEGQIAKALPVHSVYTSSFFIERYEVTGELWGEVRDWGTGNGYPDIRLGASDQIHHPINYVKWHDILKWCNARSEMEGLSPVYYTSFAHNEVYREGDVEVSSDAVDWQADGYRLPTEAEWEKAARGGFEGRAYPWGDQANGNQLNYWTSGDPYETNDSSHRSTPVGYYDGSQVINGVTNGTDMANGYGLYDMAGNIVEWCWDWYDANWYSHADSTQPNPHGPTNGTVRVQRGGGWHSPLGGSSHKCAQRHDIPYLDYDLRKKGFRCVRKADLGGS